MRRLALALLAAAALLPGSAGAAACSPLNCAPSQFTLAHGSLLGFRGTAHHPVTVVDLRTGKARFTLPAGIVGGNLLVHQAGRTLAWYDATRGTKVRTVTLAHRPRLVGVSQDGSRAVALRLTANGTTTFTIASARGQQEIRVPGRDWDFDALHGDRLFLIKYLRAGGYQVRLVRAASGVLEPKALKDPRESDVIWGRPFSRLSSPDGRYLFTLYIGSNGGSMVHELDLRTAQARCIDLPGTGDYGAATSWGLALKGQRLWAASPGYGRVVAIDVIRRAVTKAFRIDLPYWNLGSGSRAALSPDGRRLALTDGETTAVVGLARRKVLERGSTGGTAVGYSPSGRLWTLT